MNDSFSWSVGKVAGVPVRVRPSALVLVAIFGFLYFDVFLDYSQGTLGAVLASVGLGLVVILSVFLHEVAHVLSARAFGVVAHEIGLTFLGGHAGFNEPFRSPWHSLVVSLAGPAVNLVLAGGLWATSESFTTPIADSTQALVYLVVSIASFMNLLLGLFNLLPGLPLDGGNALADLVWQLSGKRSLGLRVSSRIGQVVAFGVFAYAVVVPYLQGRTPSVTSLVWSLLIAWVLWSGAKQGLRRAALYSKLSQVSLPDLMTPALVVYRDQTLADIRDPLAMVPAQTTVVVADRDGEVHGFIDMKALFEVPDERATLTAVDAVLVPLPTGSTVPPDTAVERLITAVQTAQGVRQLYVVSDGNHVIGVVWVAALMRVIRID